MWIKIAFLYLFMAALFAYQRSYSHLGMTVRSSLHENKRWVTFRGAYNKLNNFSTSKLSSVLASTGLSVSICQPITSQLRASREYWDFLPRLN